MGLKPGSQGYCTVAATANLSAPVADRLESLSGYRPVYPPGDRSANLNPVVFSHLKLSLAGQSFNVISRICAAGLDYSQRGNKYAHHMAIELEERPAAGPAWLASQRGFLDTAWTGDPRTLPKGRAVPQGDRLPTVCHQWARDFGDAGWAGVVAESFLADPNRPVYVVFEPGQNVLPLFEEALALLSRAQRWGITFSTYYTGQAQGLTCLWRGVLRDSPEAQQALRLPDALILDPKQPPGAASGAALVDQARSGIPGKQVAKDAPIVGPKAIPPSAVRTKLPRGKRHVVEELEESLPDWKPTASRRPERPAQAAAPPSVLVNVWIGLAASLILGLFGFSGWTLWNNAKATEAAQTIDRLLASDSDPAQARSYYDEFARLHHRLSEYRAVVEAKDRIEAAEATAQRSVTEVTRSARFQQAMKTAEAAENNGIEPASLAEARDLMKNRDERQKVEALARARDREYARITAAHISEMLSLSHTEQPRALFNRLTKDKPERLNYPEIANVQRKLEETEREASRIDRLTRAMNAAREASLNVRQPPSLVLARQLARTDQEKAQIEEIVRSRQERYLEKLRADFPRSFFPRGAINYFPIFTDPKTLTLDGIAGNSRIQALSLLELRGEKDDGGQLKIVEGDRRLDSPDQGTVAVSVPNRPVPNTIGWFLWTGKTLRYEPVLPTSQNPNFLGLNNALADSLLSIKIEGGDTRHYLLQDPWKYSGKVRLADHYSRPQGLPQIRLPVEHKENLGRLTVVPRECVLTQENGASINFEPGSTPDELTASIPLRYKVSGKESSFTIRVSLILDNDNQKVTISFKDWPKAEWNAFQQRRDVGAINKTKGDDRTPVPNALLIPKYLDLLKELIETMELEVDKRRPMLDQKFLDAETVESTRVQLESQSKDLAALRRVEQMVLFIQSSTIEVRLFLKVPTGEFLMLPPN